MGHSTGEGLETGKVLVVMGKLQARGRETAEGQANRTLWAG